jgi:hypothetical protein
MGVHTCDLVVVVAARARREERVDRWNGTRSGRKEWRARERRLGAWGGGVRRPRPSRRLKGEASAKPEMLSRYALDSPLCLTSRPPLRAHGPWTELVHKMSQSRSYCPQLLFIPLQHMTSYIACNQTFQLSLNLQKNTSRHKRNIFCLLLAKTLPAKKKKEVMRQIL